MINKRKTREFIPSWERIHRHRAEREACPWRDRLVEGERDGKEYQQGQSCSENVPS